MIERIAIITNIVRYIYSENAGVSPFHLPTSCTPKGVSEVLMKVALILHWFSRKCSGFLFSIQVFFHEQHLQISGLPGKREGISLTPHYNFQPLHRHLDVSWAITGESSPLHIEMNWEPLVSEQKSLTTKLRAI